MNSPRFMLLATAALVALAVLVQVPIHDRSIVPMDEGHLASFAVWMLAGQDLYRDLDTGIFPAIYFIASLLFTVFEPDILVTRWAQLVLNGVVAVGLWRVATRVARPHWALLPGVLWLALVALGFPVLTMFNYSTVSAGFALAGLLSLLRYLESGRTRDGVVLGLAIAACGLTKQNFGAFALAGVVIGLLWGWRSSVLAARAWWRVLVPVFVSGGALTLATFGYLIATGTLGAMLDATVLNLFGSQMQYFDNPIQEMQIQ